MEEWENGRVEEYKGWRRRVEREALRSAKRECFTETDPWQTERRTPTTKPPARSPPSPALVPGAKPREARRNPRGAGRDPWLARCSVGLVIA
jgi:hypothetical protein